MHVTKIICMYVIIVLFKYNEMFYDALKTTYYRTFKLTKICQGYNWRDWQYCNHFIISTYVLTYLISSLIDQQEGSLWSFGIGWLQTQTLRIQALPWEQGLLSLPQWPDDLCCSYPLKRENDYRMIIITVIIIIIGIIERRQECKC